MRAGRIDADGALRLNSGQMTASALHVLTAKYGFRSVCAC
jgi:hypothetical protein